MEQAAKPSRVQSSVEYSTPAGVTVATLAWSMDPLVRLG